MSPISFILLNFLRFLSFSACLYAILCCVFLNSELFRSIGEDNGFFQFVNRIILVLQALIVCMAESGYPQQLYVYFPYLDDKHGLGFIGGMLCWIGNSMLSLCKDQATADVKEGWTLFVLMPGWFVFSVGIVYILLGLRGPSLKSMRQFSLRGSKKDSTKQPPTSSIV
ncbi:hypothetical protein K7432_009264 [Basidiobolus ranarum]|uniref:DUF7598 domain-containing protein n=1 Tax=Basidiobolus ranarum TaxID=34480 RepID=A0ABR2WQI5_9FUNG